jgi:hypothetical protein
MAACLPNLPAATAFAVASGRAAAAAHLRAGLAAPAPSVRA